MSPLAANALTLDPAPVEVPAMHYVFIEKQGPFAVNAPQVWSQLHAILAGIAAHNTVTGYVSLYRMQEEIYRAGVSVAEPPRQLPAAVRYEPFAGGKYRKFVLRGPYPQLGEATAQAIQTVRDLRLPLRDAWNIENYVNDPRTTPEDQLITEILFPVD